MCQLPRKVGTKISNPFRRAIRAHIFIGGKKFRVQLTLYLYIALGYYYERLNY